MHEGGLAPLYLQSNDVPTVKVGFTGQQRDWRNNKNKEQCNACVEQVTISGGWGGHRD